MCFQRTSSSQTVPGCQTSGYVNSPPAGSDHDYCYRPNSKTNAVVQLVRQGHTVTQILATDLAWDGVPIPSCDDEQEPGSQPHAHPTSGTTWKCNRDYGGGLWSCGAAYPDCRGFVQNQAWGRCWKPCVPDTPWAGLAQSQFWLELTVWPDSIALQVVWDSLPTGLAGTVTSTLTVGAGNAISSASDLSVGSVSLLVTNEGGSIVQATAATFPVTVSTSASTTTRRRNTGTVLPRGLTGDVMLEVPGGLQTCSYNNNCSPSVEVLFTATNDDSVSRALRLSISKNFPLWDNSITQGQPGAEITGFSAVLLDENRIPTGMICKNACDFI